MSPFNPVAVAHRLQKLCRARRITPFDLVVGLTLLWSCRAPGRDEAQVSFDRLADLAGVGRTAAVKSVGRLRRLRLLHRQKTRLRVVWSLGIASRQGRNIYRWISSAVAEWPTNQMQVSKKEAHRGGVAAPPVRRRGGVSDLPAALASLGARIAANRGEV
jgi:hypothetical protein